MRPLRTQTSFQKDPDRSPRPLMIFFQEGRLDGCRRRNVTCLGTTMESGDLKSREVETEELFRDKVKIEVRRKR